MFDTAIKMQQGLSECLGMILDPVPDSLWETAANGSISWVPDTHTEDTRYVFSFWL